MFGKQKRDCRKDCSDVSDFSVYKTSFIGVFRDIFGDRILPRIVTANLSWPVWEWGIRPTLEQDSVVDEISWTNLNVDVVDKRCSLRCDI